MPTKTRELLSARQRALTDPNLMPRLSSPTTAEPDATDPATYPSTSAEQETLPDSPPRPFRPLSRQRAFRIEHDPTSTTSLPDILSSFYTAQDDTKKSPAAKQSTLAAEPLELWGPDEAEFVTETVVFDGAILEEAVSQSLPDSPPKKADASSPESLRPGTAPASKLDSAFTDTLAQAQIRALARLGRGVAFTQSPYVPLRPTSAMQRSVPLRPISAMPPAPPPSPTPVVPPGLKLEPMDHYPAQATGYVSALTSSPSPAPAPTLLKDSRALPRASHSFNGFGCDGLVSRPLSRRLTPMLGRAFEAGTAPAPDPSAGNDIVLMPGEIDIVLSPPPVGSRP